jgi:RNA polymerase sigma factor (sigma-70 family)
MVKLGRRYVDRGAKFSSIAYTRARGQVKDFARRQHLLAGREASIPEREAISREVDPLQAAEQRDQLAAVMVGLTDEQRRAAMLRASGLTMVELAAAMGVGVWRARMLSKSAMDLMRVNAAALMERERA